MEAAVGAEGGNTSHGVDVRARSKQIWSEQELVFLVPGKTLPMYPPKKRRHKEIQLEVNLEHALTTLADAAGRELRLQPCTEGQSP